VIERGNVPADDAAAHGPLDPPRAPGGERGRDLTLLALALVLVNEAIFTAQIVLAQEPNVLVAQAGRFAVKAGLAYMTWQGFALPRWLLAFLAAVAAAAGPWALRDAYAAGFGPWQAVLTATVVGYVAATWLLIGSRDVSAFLRHRRDLRDLRDRDVRPAPDPRDAPSAEIDRPDRRRTRGAASDMPDRRDTRADGSDLPDRRDTRADGSDVRDRRDPRGDERDTP
jgi:hypothetical protein